MNIATALKSATSVLQASGIDEPRREAAALMGFVLGQSRAYLIAHDDQELSAAQSQLFSTAIERRAAREPLQYITGTAEFCGYEFEVRPGVLIPRPETEMLVAAAAEYLRTIPSPRFLEIGIGTGCIAISVLKDVQSSSAVGVDIAPEPVELTRRNADLLHVGDRLDLRIGDLFQPVAGERFNAVISNPPYVPAADLPQLQPEVRDFEPHKALTDGGSGLSIIQRIVDAAPEHLIPGGLLAIEFGFGQASAVANMFDRSIWSSIQVANDIRSIERMVTAKVTRS